MFEDGLFDALSKVQGKGRPMLMLLTQKYMERARTAAEEVAAWTANIVAKQRAAEPPLEEAKAVL